MALINSNLAIFFMFFLSMVGLACADYYGSNPELNKPDLEVQDEKPISPIIVIQGLVYCKSGDAPIPLKGAVARITCLGVNGKGVESAPFSLLSNPADKKGYYFASLSPSQLQDNCNVIKECKSFLEYSPWETCKVPTDINNGTTGALLSNFEFLDDKKVKLYSVKPFYYTATPKVSHGY